MCSYLTVFEVPRVYVFAFNEFEYNITYIVHLMRDLTVYILNFFSIIFYRECDGVFPEY